MKRDRSMRWQYRKLPPWQLSVGLRFRYAACRDSNAHRRRDSRADAEAIASCHLAVRLGIMRSDVSLKRRLRRRSGGVALHKSALRIISDARKSLRTIARSRFASAPERLTTGKCGELLRFTRVHPTLLCHVLPHDIRQPERTGTRVVAIGKHQVEIAPTLAALAQRKWLQHSALQFPSHGLLREPSVPEAHAGGVDRSRLVAHRPTLLRADPAAAAALTAGISDHQMTVLAQIL